jgi:hypothetical protein
MRASAQTANGTGVEGGAAVTTEVGRWAPHLDTRVARFDAAGDCATYNATQATFAANVAAARVSFINLPTRARRARLRFHSSDGQTVAPFVLIVVNAPDDAAANRILSSAFFSGAVELTGAGTSQLGALDLLVLSKDNAAADLECESIDRIDAVAIYGGAAAGAAALEVNVC